MLNIPLKEAIVIGEERVFRMGGMQDGGDLLTGKPVETEVLSKGVKRQCRRGKLADLT